MLIKVYKCTLFEKSIFPQECNIKALRPIKGLRFFYPTWKLASLSVSMDACRRPKTPGPNTMHSTIYSNNRAEYQHFSCRFLSPGSRRAVLTQPGDSLVESGLHYREPWELREPTSLWWGHWTCFPFAPRGIAFIIPTVSTLALC